MEKFWKTREQISKFQKLNSSCLRNDTFCQTGIEESEQGYARHANALMHHLLHFYVRLNHSSNIGIFIFVL